MNSLYNGIIADLYNSFSTIFIIQYSLVYIRDTVNPLGISGNHFLLVKGWLNSQGMQIVVGERKGGHTFEIIHFYYSKNRKVFNYETKK